MIQKGSKSKRKQENRKRKRKNKKKGVNQPTGPKPAQPASPPGNPSPTLSLSPLAHRQVGTTCQAVVSRNQLAINGDGNRRGNSSITPPSTHPERSLPPQRLRLALLSHSPLFPLSLSPYFASDRSPKSSTTAAVFASSPATW